MGVERYAVELVEPLGHSRQEASAAALRALVEKTGVQGYPVAIALAEPLVFTRVLQLEKSLQQGDLQEHIEVGLETWTPFSAEEVFYDFALLPQQAEGSKIQEVLLAVARKEVVQAEQAWIEASGLKVAVVEGINLALERAFRLFLSAEDRSSILSSDFFSASGEMALLQSKLGGDLSLLDPFAKLIIPSRVDVSCFTATAHHWLLVLGLAAWSFDND